MEESVSTSRFFLNEESVRITMMKFKSIVSKMNLL